MKGYNCHKRQRLYHWSCLFARITKGEILNSAALWIALLLHLTPSCTLWRTHNKPYIIHTLKPCERLPLIFLLTIITLFLSDISATVNSYASFGCTGARSINNFVVFIDIVQRFGDGAWFGLSAKVGINTRRIQAVDGWLTSSTYITWISVFYASINSLDPTCPSFDSWFNKVGSRFQQLQ